MKQHCHRVHTTLTLAILLFSLVFSLASVQPVAAQSGTWYVSTLGTDDNVCSAPELPCLTINGAIAKAADGDTVKVAIGTYTSDADNEVVLINKSISLSGGWDEGFTAQNGTSTINAGGTRRGISVTNSSTAVVAYFTITNGFHSVEGGGIYNVGTLTLNNSVVTGNVSRWMGGGIFSSGILTVNDSTIRGNSAGYGQSGGGGGGGIQNYNGTATVNNSTISNNRLLGDYDGSGIDSASGTLILNNSTVSGNTSRYAEGIGSFTATIILNNSTITKNQPKGVKNGSGKLTIRNTIIAGNGTEGDCYGGITSLGYNLIGNNQRCPNFTPTIGDLVGTPTNPIDPKLGPLRDNGGPTFTHALLSGSPALNAGNPAEPGSGENACMPTDQRGVIRPDGGACDMGAYEGYITTVTSINRLRPSPIVASSVKFLVTFPESVTGVNLTKPYSDFALTANGLKSAMITAVSRTGNTYTVTVKLGAWNENATIRLDVVDDDSILDLSGRPLGGPGTGNGNFTSGQAYKLKRVPSPLSPKNTIIYTTPTFKWTRIYGGAKYQFAVLKGTEVIYTKTVPASACGTTQCASTTTLDFGSYKWKVRAWSGGVWQNYSPAKAFKLFPAQPGFWEGNGENFYVTTNGPKVVNFTFRYHLYGCQPIIVTYPRPLTITDKKFSFTGSFYANGTFDTPTRASGTWGLDRFPNSNCGRITVGPIFWSAIWKHSGQSTIAVEAADGLTITLIPDLQLPGLQLPSDAFTVEPVE